MHAGCSLGPRLLGAESQGLWAEDESEPLGLMLPGCNFNNLNLS